jgi:carbon storage regulator CsrA
MLTLYRQEGESIFIGKNDAIKITLLKNTGNSVKIGILAPAHMPIRREELPPLPTCSKSIFRYLLEDLGCFFKDLVNYIFCRSAIKGKN